MPKIVLDDNRVPIFAWTGDIEETALEQLSNCANMPFIHKWIAAMPDVHAGYGATIGSVIPTHKAIIPSAVGVDIGCGMLAAKTNLIAKDLPDNIDDLRNRIESRIPVGQAHHIEAKNGDYMRAHHLRRIQDKHKGIIQSKPEMWILQQGTLGGGNHFIELCLDEKDHVWIMLHSGSRGIGNSIGRYFIEKAKEEMERYFITLPDKDLAFLAEGTELFNDYVDAVSWAQDYAKLNRELMYTAILRELRKLYPSLTVLDEVINCHHNYVEKENHYGRNVYVTRKGAIRARVNDLGIIPGSMGTRSYIVRGKGNPESFCSCSHGAGRRMSRGKAREIFTTKDLEEQTKGISCRKDYAVLDEIPGAYKDIDKVMENQSDLVEVVHTLHQILNIKG